MSRGVKISRQEASLVVMVMKEQKKRRKERRKIALSFNSGEV